MRFCGRKRQVEHEPPAEVYLSLREQILGLTADQLGAGAFADESILALLMETGYPEAVATLVAVVDGATSLYFSNGGGFIGAGTHAEVAEASLRWLGVGRDLLTELKAVTGHPPIPGEGETQFVAVTRDGLRGAVAAEGEFGGGNHYLSPLFYAGQDVITQIRLTQGG